MEYIYHKEKGGNPFFLFTFINSMIELNKNKFYEKEASLWV